MIARDVEVGDIVHVSYPMEDGYRRCYLYRRISDMPPFIKAANHTPFVRIMSSHEHETTGHRKFFFDNQCIPTALHEQQPVFSATKSLNPLL